MKISYLYLHILNLSFLSQSCQCYVFLYVGCTLLIGAFSNCIRLAAITSSRKVAYYNRNHLRLSRGINPVTLQDMVLRTDIRQFHNISTLRNQHAYLRHHVLAESVIFSNFFENVIVFFDEKMTSLVNISIILTENLFHENASVFKMKGKQSGTYFKVFREK